VVVGAAVLVVVLPPSALFSFLVARRTTARLEKLAAATAALRAGEYSTRVEVEGEDEVAQLQADFNAMAVNLEKTLVELAAERDKVARLLDARRELVASVSHELRTPVATIRGYLESLRPVEESESLGDSLSCDLEVMEEEVLQLQRLIDDLFTLSRAEVNGLAWILSSDRSTLVRSCDAAWRHWRPWPGNEGALRSSLTCLETCPSCGLTRDASTRSWSTCCATLCVTQIRVASSPW